MKRIGTVLLALFFCIPFSACEKQDELPWPPPMYEVVVKLHYEEGDPREGREILDGDIIVYEYDGNQHGPTGIAFYGDRKAGYVYVVYIIQDEDGRETIARPRKAGQYDVKVVLKDSDTYYAEPRFFHMYIVEREEDTGGSV